MAYKTTHTNKKKEKCKISKEKNRRTREQMGILQSYSTQAQHIAYTQHNKTSSTRRISYNIKTSIKDLQTRFREYREVICNLKYDNVCPVLWLCLHLCL